MPNNYISPISMDALSNLCSELDKNNWIKPNDYQKYHVKRGLRNEDGTGVMAGLTRICSVEGYYILDGERIPKDGKLSYRGYDINDIVNGCINEGRFGFEEVVWLLLFGDLPTESQLEGLREVLGECRELPDEFVEDMIMKHASKDIMNKMARCVIVLYSFDENPDDISVANVLRQSLQLIAQMPTIMNGAYQIKRRTFYNKTMFLHQLVMGSTNSQVIDHKDRNKRNCIKSNLHFTTQQQNILNRPMQKNNTSGYVGVSINKDIKTNKGKKYSVHISKDNKSYSKSFYTIEEAVAWRREMEDKLFSEFYIYKKDKLNE